MHVPEKSENLPSMSFSAILLVVNHVKEHARVSALVALLIHVCLWNNTPISKRCLLKNGRLQLDLQAIIQQFTHMRKM